MKGRDFVPCLYVKGKSPKVLLHFHANGEDIGQTIPLMRKINLKMKFSIICMEYPGYGLYQIQNSPMKGAEAPDNRAK
jgi:hypothetical protein